jgi:hypothetical protein
LAFALLQPQLKERAEMSGKSQLSVRAAVMNGLARCTESESPVCCLAEFLEKLVALGWEPGDVAQVQRAVLQLLGDLQERQIGRRQSDRADHRMTGKIANQPTISSRKL